MYLLKNYYFFQIYVFSLFSTYLDILFFIDILFYFKIVIFSNDDARINFTNAHDLKIFCQSLFLLFIIWNERKLKATIAEEEKKNNCIPKATNRKQRENFSLHNLLSPSRDFISRKRIYCDSEYFLSLFFTLERKKFLIYSYRYNIELYFFLKIEYRHLLTEQFNKKNWR